MSCFAISSVVQTLLYPTQCCILLLPWSSSQQADTTDLYELVCDRYEVSMTGISGIHQLLLPTDQMRIHWLLTSRNILDLFVKVGDGPE